MSGLAADVRVSLYWAQVSVKVKHQPQLNNDVGGGFTNWSFEASVGILDFLNAVFG